MKNIKKQVFSLLTLGLIIFSFKAISQTAEDGYQNLEAERYTAAGEIFKKLATSSPSIDNYFNYGYYLLQTPDGTKPETIKLAEDAFTAGDNLAGKKDMKNKVGLGMVKLAKKDFPGAKALFDEAIKTSKGKSPEVFSKIAMAYVVFPNSNNPAEAIMNADKALEIAKTQGNIEPYIAKAKAYTIKNDGGNAMNALENADRLAKPNQKANIYAMMSRLWLQAKKYDKADGTIKMAIAADQKFAPAYEYQSSFYQTFQKWQESADAAKNFLKYSDGDCASKLRYAKIAYLAKDYDNSLKAIEDVKKCSNDPIVYRLEGIAKFEQKDYMNSIAQMQKYISTAKKEDIYGLDYGYIGRDYLAMHGTPNANDEKALEYIEKAYAMGDTTYNYYQDVSNMYKADKNWTNAVTYGEKALKAKRNPGGDDYANLAILYMQNRDYVKADPTWDKVCELYKDSWPQAYYQSGLVKTYLIEKGSTNTYPAAARYEKYLSLLTDEQKAAPANKANVIVALKALAGKAFAIDKNNAKAIQYINEVKKLDPSDPQADALLNQINSGVVPTPSGN